ncbi:unnamed protein product [Medioppia subpectinata]|uniref:F-box domain-containing protein n=1 Tax=Medioppia subpectinata TaxID=1979941 RepID=A0A7R9KFC0_9ACAR|nr:unnamed protein product [Medioppia subpectinata]CAG2102516.1 unnamed protein product [Medioppia subpectinata]
MAKQITSMDPSIGTTDDGNKQKPKIYAKDSMDRYGDDLCEVVLTYLSLEDRLRCECVSTQFRRTAFKSVVDIEITDWLIKQIQVSKQTIRQTMTAIAIKCPNVETIDCREIDFRREQHIPEVLAIFRDNCHHLRNIYCYLTPRWGQLLAEFGPLVTRIGNIISFRDYAAVTVCHRLSQLRVNSLREVFANNFDIGLVKPVLKLELDMHYNRTIDNDRLSAFVAHNQCLQSLAVRVCWVNGAEELTEMCGQVSRLAQLRRLTLGLLFGIPDSSVVNQCLRTIGVNCKQLHHLSLWLRFSSKAIDSSLPISLDSLRFCSQLKRLDLDLNEAIDDRLLDPLRHCERLTHLELDLPTMTANVLKDLHINCPRLKCLRIRNLNNIIDTECLNRIACLPALKTLVIVSNHNIHLLDKDFSDFLLLFSANCCLSLHRYCNVNNKADK